MSIPDDVTRPLYSEKRTLLPGLCSFCRAFVQCVLWVVCSFSHFFPGTLGSSSIIQMDANSSLYLFLREPQENAMFMAFFPVAILRNGFIEWPLHQWKGQSGSSCQDDAGMSIQVVVWGPTFQWGPFQKVVWKEKGFFSFSKLETLWYLSHTSC